MAHGFGRLKRLAVFGFLVLRLSSGRGLDAALEPQGLRCLSGKFSEHYVDDADIWCRGWE